MKAHFFFLFLLLIVPNLSVLLIGGKKSTCNLKREMNYKHA